MLNFELSTEPERREAAAIERRRAQDEERKKRIFGPKAKIFIDHVALREQIEEKKIRDKEERQQNEVFEERARQYALIAKQLEEKECLERKKQLQEINQFRLHFQKKEDRRESDINNSKSIPARMFDDDPRCGLASMQKFDGEDQYAKERHLIQVEQTKVWLDQQMDEKDRADRERRQAEEAYREATRARDQQARELEKLELECKQRLSLACMDYNKALADERDELRRTHKKEEEQDILAHNYNVMMSDMMMESVDVTAPENGRNGRKMKGQSRAERATMLQEQKLLAREARERKELEKRRDKEFDDYANGISITVAAIDADLNRKKLEVTKAIAAENLRMSKEHREREQFLKKVVYTNRPSDEFYEQFNKTAR